jgi:peptide/nickel transport system substrate-binding protein
MLNRHDSCRFPGVIHEGFMKRRTFFKTAASAAALTAPSVRHAAAQSPPTRKETLILVQEYGPNSMDMQGIGASQPVNGVSLNCYDTLIRFKRVPYGDGIMTHDLKDYDPAAGQQLAGRERRHELYV